MTTTAKCPPPHPDSTGRPPPQRLGPRPLQFHLLMTQLTWMQSRGGLRAWKSGSLPWNPALTERAEQLKKALDQEPIEDVQQALDGVIQERSQAFLAAIKLYREHPYHRQMADPPIIWQDGGTRLLDYGQVLENGDPARRTGKSNGRVARSKFKADVLVVPSLVNRAYILDLRADHSLMRWLAGQGFRPLLLDWGYPGPAERSFNLTDYVAGRSRGS